MMGIAIGVIKGDARSLDYSSHDAPYMPRNYCRLVFTIITILCISTITVLTSVTAFQKYH